LALGVVLPTTLWLQVCLFVLRYEMLEGKTPFGGEKMDEMRLYQKITEFKGNLEFPSHFSAEAPSARPRTRRAVLRLLVAVRCARCSVRDLARPKPKPCGCR
jgi:serine/threonine protein kinase